MLGDIGIPVGICRHMLECHDRAKSVPDLPTEDWKWDQETRDKATGLKCALMNFQNIVALVVLQSGLGTVKGLSSKLQKRNSDIYHAYQMIDSVITDVVEMRESVDTCGAR